MASIFCPVIFCLKTADFWNAARTVRSPGFLGLALPRAIEFFRRLTVMHTMRWHAHYKTGGTGHLYRGRFKSFPIQTDGHLLTVMRYVERNPVRANLIELAENREWSSAYARLRRADERRWLAFPLIPRCRETGVPGGTRSRLRQN
jgi:hypothetical protein